MIRRREFLLALIAWPLASFASRQTLIQPVSGGMNRAWQYDGRILRRWRGIPVDDWVYEENVLRPAQGSLRQAWRFDGHRLDPYLGGTLGWRYDGRVLQPGSGDLRAAWYFDGRLFRPYLGGYEASWEVVGKAPIPVIAKAAGVI